MMTIQPSDGFEKYICDKASEKKIPISGTIELLPICNMDCKMCYIKTSVSEMNKMGKTLSVDKWLAIAKQLKENGTLFLLLTGGEPLLYHGFKELYQKISEMGIIITINTNGTLINDKIVELFKNNPPRRVNVSLYGASKETYEKVCGYGPGFEQTMTAIKKLIAAKIPVKVNFTLNKENKDDLFKVIKITEELNIPISTPTYMFPPIRKLCDNHDFESHRLSPKEAAKIQYEISKYGINEDPLNVQGIHNVLDKVNPKYFNNSKKEAPGGFLCSAGVRSFWINWLGILTPCGMMPYPKCDLKETSFKDGWDYIKQESEKIYTSSECYSCRFRNICQNCAASSLAENGKTDTVVEYHCHLCNKYEKSLQKLVKEVEQDENK